MDETWLPVVGYEGLYEVSDHGQVRSLDRWASNGKVDILYRGRMIAQSGSPYLAVRIYKQDGGQTKRIHALVAEAFLGPRPKGLEVCHNNGDKLDNRLANLRYDTKSANMRDSVQHGTNLWANRTHCPQGHEYTPENTHGKGIKGNGRRCVECIRERWKRDYDAQLEREGKVRRRDRDVCKQGHPFDGHNGKQRTCSTCQRRYSAEYRERIKA